MACVSGAKDTSAVCERVDLIYIRPPFYSQACPSVTLKATGGFFFAVS